MKTCWFLLLFVVGVHYNYGFIVGSSSVCHHGWEYFNNACYLFSREQMTWTEAFSYCRIFKSDLVEISDANENNFLKSHLSKIADSNACYYTAGLDSNIEGEWEWAGSNHRIEYTDWAPSEPSNSNGGENCICLFGPLHFDWNDNVCSSPGNFICKTPSGNATRML